MEATRRQFLKGLAATLGFGALGGYGRLFAVPQLWKPGRTPNLVFGVISDTHLISSRRKREELMWTRTRHPFGNEKGEFAEIQLEWKDAAKTLVIGARRGSYPGMAKERDFAVTLPDGRSRSVRYAGERTEVRF